MKTVIFIRHAKSSWAHNLEDKMRPLDNTGVFDAGFMSNLSVVKVLAPDIVFCSTAKRTISTCDYFIKAGVFPKSRVYYTDDLYDFNGGGVLFFLKNINDKYKRVILFGHNNALTNLVNNLGSKAVKNLPTCGIVQISFTEKEWRSVSSGKTDLVLFPKNFR